MTPRLDSSLAWKTATRLVATNRDMLMAIAGVFFLLPGLAFTIFVPEPQMAPGTPPGKMMEIMAEAWTSSLPLLIVVTLLQMAGTVTMLIVMTDPQRPTVAQAISRGFRALGPYMLAQLIVGGAIGMAFLVLVSAAALTGVQAIGAIVILAAFVAMIWCSLRMALVAPVLAIEAERNPVQALRRSWALTQGNSGRLLAFFVLLGVVFAVVYGLAMMLVGVVLVLTTGGELQRVLTAAVSSAITSGALVYFIAILAAVYRQLAGPPTAEIRSVFD
ncbi:glycerophosphoryl diester phosphodiesterase membrane domain-containing protein [Novosphingobium jiangmenense]|uniref:Glycerophosphoryl diester phosphodiesterase membrane domain-containing protein n=1 Tax=Novosphingobium jiangmenense TaxID=2791981 RepID=A0ABS0HFD9_9SPHN|nr:glycerophosphoryl diester phosphodiesterase membrane domain-containing protein [Novosphingobium jiangmenense]MBF9150975.1 glycerophosphoryl diester phosphodiesterase membrane domain-containing protein [Novosphingobium jiangmenense]